MVFGGPKSKTSSAEFTLSVAVGPIADRRELISSFGLPAAAADLLVACRLRLTRGLLLCSTCLALPITLPPVAVRHVLIAGLRFLASAACLLVADRLLLTHGLLLRTARLAIRVAAFPITIRRVRSTGMGYSTATARLAIRVALHAAAAAGVASPQALQCLRSAQSMHTRCSVYRRSSGEKAAADFQSRQPSIQSNGTPETNRDTRRQTNNNRDSKMQEKQRRTHTNLSTERLLPRKLKTELPYRADE